MGHAVLIGIVQVGLFVPVGPEGHERSLGDPAVLGLPGLQVVHRQHEVGVGGALGGLVDDHQGIHQLLDGDRAHVPAAAPEVPGHVGVGAVLAGHAVLDTAHRGHHVLRRALRIVEQQVRLQGLEAEPMGRLRTQLMCQVHPLVLGGLQLFDLLPQCQIRHNVFPPFHVTGYACLQTRYASR
ncbi:Uncharacterised protein [uncultured Blautia sp.]|nr:Uncharacterised protein [uncultured Blautia sp.]